MKEKTFFQKADALVPRDGILLGTLRLVVTLLEPLTLNALFKRVVKKQVVVAIPGEKPKSPRWVSEIWIILCFLLAIFGLSFAVQIQVPPKLPELGLFLLCVAWPILRLSELLLFVIGWIFVHDDMLHSIQRSLLSFIVNLFEISLLLTALTVSLGTTAIVDPWGTAYQTFVNVLTLVPPDMTKSGLEYALELFRFWFGLVVVLCIIGSLAGGVVRRTVPRE